jgi:hypothetical protein
MIASKADPGCGVLTIAHGDLRFARQAVALARSIRLRDPDLPLAVATDLPAALFEGMFDSIIEWNFAAGAELVSKLDAYEMSPYDVTLFLDSDILLFASLQAVFEHFDGDDFGVVGRNLADPGYFESIDLIRGHIPSETFPLFNSGMFYFVKSTAAENLLRSAKSLLLRYDELKIQYSQGMLADEPLLCLAMAMAGRRAKTGISAGGIHLQTIWPSSTLVEVDVIAGRCRQYSNGQRTSRLALHYYGGKMQHYGYVRETLRLQAAFRGRERRPYFDLLVRIRAFWIWLTMPPLGVGKIRISIVKRLRATIDTLFHSTN